MKLKNLLPIVMLGAFILAPSTADAQFDKTWKDWFGHIQGGYSMVQGDLDNDSVIYLEAKYHWVDTQATAKFMPISIGYRW